MIKAIAEYAHRGEVPPEPGFSAKYVRWGITCDDSGRFLDVITLGDTSDKRNRGKLFPKCPDLSQGELIAGGIAKSHFLVETADVVSLLGIEDDGTVKPKKAGGGKNDERTVKKIRAKHTWFVDSLKGASTESAAILAVYRCLSTTKSVASIREKLAEAGASASDKVTFIVDGVFPVDSGDWHAWWRKQRADTGGHRSTDAATMRCFLTGELVAAVSTHPPIKGLGSMGGQPSGSVLIGFDKPAFESYGLDQSLNCAMSEQAAKEYTAALNELIQTRGRELAGLLIVPWFKEQIPDEDSPLWLLNADLGEDSEAQAEQRARELLNSVRSGKRPDLASNRYYTLGLSGSGGRVMVREWMEGSFEELAANVDGWFADLRIVEAATGTIVHAPRMIALVEALLPKIKRSDRSKKWDRLPPALRSGMWRAAVQNSPLPDTALPYALKRTTMQILSGEMPLVEGIALLKAWNIRNYRRKGDETMAAAIQPILNRDYPDPAYQCGRLMAVLAAVQRAALGDVNAGIVQRYYAAASTTPALVFGRLIRNAQFHLNSLKDKRGLAVWFEKRIAEISGKLTYGIPATLTLEQQSLFALGYYQQLAERSAATSDDKARKDEGNGEQNAQ